jgi:hypothetical protein
MNLQNYPELKMLYAIPNGGHRHKAVAGKLKAEGVKAGVWDVALDVGRNGFHGLRIEMKFGYNKLTASQVEWGRRYVLYNYSCAVCRKWEKAAAAILHYLDYDIPEDLK